MELSDLSKGTEAIELVAVGMKDENPVRRILDSMLVPTDPR